MSPRLLWQPLEGREYQDHNDADDYQSGRTVFEVGDIDDLIHLLLPAARCGFFAEIILPLFS
jgi:hypothetical protein